ncbi:MAG: methyltransferase domain-containing protein [Methanoregula sp.]|jgi:cobalt-precorrin-6B (C15)-methyltransferase
MVQTKPAGGPTQDEIMAVSLFKMGLQSGDVMLDLGCGTGKVSRAAARVAKKVYAVDRRPEAIRYAQEQAAQAGLTNIEFFCGEARDFLKADLTFDCAFLGGSQQIGMFLPALSKKVRRTIVVNAVMVSTLASVIDVMQQTGIFTEAIQVQVSRSYGIAGSIMFKPIDPVYIIVGGGAAC